eukprot:10967151-Prorocentrum_lima.AAC.1
MAPVGAAVIHAVVVGVFVSDVVAGVGAVGVCPDGVSGSSGGGSSSLSESLSSVVSVGAVFWVTSVGAS